MRGLFSGLLLLVVAPTQADGLWLHLGSKHHDGRDYNEFNPGLGVEHSLDARDEWRVEWGVYQNSFRDPSRYVLLKRELPQLGPLRRWEIRTDGALGTADAYGGTDMRKGEGKPMGGFIFEYRQVRLFMIPKVVTALSWRVMEW